MDVVHMKVCTSGLKGCVQCVCAVCVCSVYVKGCVQYVCGAHVSEVTVLWGCYEERVETLEKVTLKA